MMTKIHKITKEEWLKSAMNSVNIIIFRLGINEWADPDRLNRESDTSAYLISLELLDLINKINNDNDLCWDDVDLGKYNDPDIEKINKLIRMHNLVGEKNELSMTPKELATRLKERKKFYSLE